MIKNLIVLLAGLIFGFGLSISQMLDPREIMGFLDVASGSWDPSLLLVMASALIVVSIGYRMALKGRKPVLDKEFHIPTNSKIDRKLIFGAILFGIGWGLIAYCPGPIITSLGFLSIQPVIIFFSMIAGMLSWSLVDSKLIAIKKNKQ